MRGRRRFEGSRHLPVNAHVFNPAIHLKGERFLTAAENFKRVIVGMLQGALYTVAADEDMGARLEVGINKGIGRAGPG